MKISHHLGAAAALAAALAFSLATVPVRAGDRDAMPTDPGFKPDTGQINPGVEEQAPSQSSEIIRIPTPEEARAAFMAPVSKQPSLGETPDALRPDPQTFGGPGGQSGSATTGIGPIGSAEPRPSGPIGAVGETVPAKFSKRNDILDRVPIMAWPLPLSDQQRKQIYEAVKGENSQPTPGADALKPASELSTNQALNAMYSLPASVRDIDGVAGLQYVKAKDKILLVEPSTRIVVDQITSK